MGMSQADNSVKIWQNLPLEIPNLYNINAHTKFGENPLTLTQVIIQKWYRDGWRDIHRETMIPSPYRVTGYKN